MPEANEDIVISTMYLEFMIRYDSHISLLRLLFLYLPYVLFEIQHAPA